MVYPISGMYILVSYFLVYHFREKHSRKRNCCKKRKIKLISKKTPQSINSIGLSQLDLSVLSKCCKKKEPLPLRVKQNFINYVTSLTIPAISKKDLSVPVPRASAT